MIVLGLQSGTSADAVDAAAADLTLDDGRVVVRPIGASDHPYPPPLRDRVERLASGRAVTAGEVCRLHADLGRTFATVAATAVEELDLDAAELVVSHGQTVHHAVEDGRVVATLQLGDPAWIAERTGAPVVSDLRVRDVAAGGQGAPLVSLVDALLLAGTDRPQAALNLGGIANVTVVTPDRDPVAFDVGPGNALLDAAARQDGADRDEGGARAARGRVDRRLLAALLDDPYRRRPPPKTTGKERYGRDRLDRVLADAPVDDLDDVLATLTAAVARSVGDALRPFRVGRVTASGGGVHNATLMRRLEAEVAPAELVTSEALGLPPDSKEAYAFAVLGFLTWNGLPGTIPSCTGARAARILGCVTPGSGPLRLPAPAGERPRRIVIAGGR